MMNYAGIGRRRLLVVLLGVCGCGGNTDRRLDGNAGHPEVGGRSGLAGGGSSTSGGHATAGGSVATGGLSLVAGTTATGGTATVTGGSGNGGATSTGGASTSGASSTGGKSATGGAPASGGSTSSTGGKNATGGLAGTGGAPATGGKGASGGTGTAGGATGGKSATGGLAATGGQAATGGTKNTGGASATGGLPATGGLAATGGTPPCIELLSSTAAVTTATAGLTATTEDFTRQADGSPVDPSMFAVIYGDSYFYQASVKFESIGVSNQDPGTVSNLIVGTGASPTHITSMIGDYNGYDGIAALFASPQSVVATSLKGSSNTTGGYSFVVVRSDGAANQTFAIPPATQSIAGAVSHCGAIITSVQILPNTGASTSHGTEYWELYTVTFAR